MIFTPDERIRGESGATGWCSLEDLLHKSEPILRNILFLEGDGGTPNIYVVVGDYLTIVDPGNDYTAFADLFNLPDYDPSDVNKIVLTHCHPDHSMGTLELFRYSGIAHNEELELMLHETGPTDLKRVIQQFGFGIRELKGGEIVDLGGYEWEMVHTPGHTPDSICLMHPPSRTVLTGDTVLAHTASVPDEKAGGRWEHYLCGLRALLENDIETVLPGHGRPIAYGGMRTVEESYLAVIRKVGDIGLEASWIEAAGLLAEKGFLAEAVYCCDKELALSSQSNKALNLKALCLNDLGRFEESLLAFENLGKLRSKSQGEMCAHLGKGFAHMGLGRYEESVGDFDAVLKMDPENKEALICKAFALYLSGKYEEAMMIDHFKEGFTAKIKREFLKRMQGPKQNWRE